MSDFAANRRVYFRPHRDDQCPKADGKRHAGFRGVRDGARNGRRVACRAEGRLDPAAGQHIAGPYAVRKKIARRQHADVWLPAPVDVWLDVDMPASDVPARHDAAAGGARVPRGRAAGVAAVPIDTTVHWLPRPKSTTCPTCCNVTPGLSPNSKATPRTHKTRVAASH